MRTILDVAKDLVTVFEQMRSLKERAASKDPNSFTPKQIHDFSSSVDELVARRVSLWGEFIAMRTEIENGNPKRVTEDDWNCVVRMLTPYISEAHV